MPPRLGHTKSRGGCWRCKLRKVKCDEVHPRCGSCVRHDIDCSYGNPTKEIADETQAGAARLSDEQCVSEPREDTPDTRRTRGRDHHLEMFLVWHLVGTIGQVYAMEADSTMRQALTETMLRHVFQHTFLLDACLTVAAQNIVLSRDKTSPMHPAFAAVQSTIIPSAFEEIDFGHVQALYLDQTVRGHRAALDAIATENAEAVCLSSILICISLYQPSPTLSSAPNMWLKMARAIPTVTAAAIPYLPEESPVRSVFALADFGSWEDVAESPPQDIGPWFLALQSVQVGEKLLNEEEAACQVTLALIRSMYTAAKRGEEPHAFCRRCMAFGAVVPELFVTSVERQQPRALVVLAHFVALTKVEAQIGYGWFSGFAEREIRVLELLLPPDWSWAMEWPRWVIEQWDGQVDSL